MSDNFHEFDAVLTMRLRIQVGGPKDREMARALLEQAINGGMNIFTFAKRGADGHPIATMVDDIVMIEEPL